MNGPTIISNAREQLADETFGYREPIPAPLNISPWVAMSCLQKAIRRCECELVPRHSDYDWLILSQSRIGKSSGATSIWILRATPG